MGSIFSELPLKETDNLANTPPTRADWLTSHADATGLAVVEVERLWNRFKQLTGSNDQTKLNDNSALPSELSNDIFVRNFLKHVPHSKSESNVIPFGYFILVMQWLESASVYEKLEAIFFYLNNGDPIDTTMLARLLKHVYKETKEDEIKALSQQCMRELCGNENGKLNQKEFIAGVERCISQEELEDILSFAIIPSHVLDEANILPSLQSSSVNIRNPQDFSSESQLSDEQLRKIANQSAKKNWSKLALTLGFLEYDIEAYRARNDGDSAAAMFDLLCLWREQEGALATKDRLRRCLQDSGMSDLSPLLN